MVCRPERPPAQYTIDFSAAQALDYIPVSRTACMLSGADLMGPGARLRLAPADLAFAQLVDGRRSIGEIAATIAHRGDGTAGETEDHARKLFQELWLLDFLAMAIDACSA
jgi:hypothetical protein